MNSPIFCGAKRSSRASDCPKPGRSIASTSNCFVSPPHTGANAKMLSGHGLKSTIFSPPLPFVAWRILSPSTVRHATANGCSSCTIPLLTAPILPRHGRLSGERRAWLRLLRSERRELFAPKCGAGNAPATFRRFRQKHPRARALRGVAADVRHDGGHVLHELLLAASRQCGWRRDDLHADCSWECLGRGLNHRWIHPVNECGGVLQVKRTGRADTFGPQDRTRQCLADPAVGFNGKQIGGRADIYHRHRESPVPTLCSLYALCSQRCPNRMR